jgi:hypothetical protein
MVRLCTESSPPYSGRPVARARRQRWGVAASNGPRAGLYSSHPHCYDSPQGLCYPTIPRRQRGPGRRPPNSSDLHSTPQSGRGWSRFLHCAPLHLPRTGERARTFATNTTQGLARWSPRPQVARSTTRPQPLARAVTHLRKMQKATITLTPVFSAPCVTNGFQFSRTCYVCNKVCGPIHSEGQYLLPQQKEPTPATDRDYKQIRKKSLVGQALLPNTL